MKRRASLPPPLDVYLQPAVVGGGLGDIEEVLAVGRRLHRLGWVLRVYRKGGRPLPRSVEGPWNWPPVRFLRRLRPQSHHALTVTPWWGVSAVPVSEHSGPPGPWSDESAEIEKAYRPERVVHLSLEEFARTLTSRQQTRERWREGGISLREISRRDKDPKAESEVRRFHEAYRKWRAFDRSNVLHLFTGFYPSPAFVREFPEAIQTGPLWPDLGVARPRRPHHRRWVWYASPSTSDRLAGELTRSVPAPPRGVPPLEIEVRGPHRFALPPGAGLRWHWKEAVPYKEWSREFAAAELRIVTGSRTLLEGIAAGGPFLYFNGVLNRGSRTRRHRPEKVEALLEVWRRRGVSPALRRDLADFSRLRSVGRVVRRALGDRRWGARFPPRSRAVDFPLGWADAGPLIDAWALEWAGSPGGAESFVREAREFARRPRSVT